MQVVGCDACTMDDVGSAGLDRDKTWLGAPLGDDAGDFGELVTPLLVRLARQQDHSSLAAADLARLVSGLWTALAAAGWSPRGGREVAADQIEPIVLRALIAVPEVGPASVWANSLRQVVKALTYPELAECRLSYAQVDTHGACRRQSVDVARSRVSGAHCVDCPYWTTVSAVQHRALLAASWHAGATVSLTESESVFLPEDFRRLRRWRWSARRPGEASALG